MSPPPPPLGRGRKRASQAFDAALDDAELATARTALNQGRWTDVRALLAATGDDWDRRGHRVTVLAQEPATLAWARDWQLAEPESADAAVLLGCAAVERALHGKERPDSAREACRSGRRPSPPTTPLPGSDSSFWSARSEPRTTWSASSTRCATGTPSITTRTT